MHLGEKYDEKFYENLNKMVASMGKKIEDFMKIIEKNNSNQFKIWCNLEKQIN